VLAGRGIGPWLAGRLAAEKAGEDAAEGAVDQAAPGGRAARVVVACVLIAFGAGYLSDLGYNASQPSSPAVNQVLAEWLVAHKLTSGLGGYWDANVTSLDSGGKVRVAPVVNGNYGYLWVAKAAWFDPKVSSANFVIAHEQRLGAGYEYVGNVIDRYGKPAQEYHLGQTVVLVYDRNLLKTVIQPVLGYLKTPPAGYGTAPG